MIDARLVAGHPPFRLDLRLHVAAGEVVALLGPAGCGKTTALRVLAGLTPSLGGYVLLDGAAVHARAPRRRSVAMAGRDPLLFPHLTALDNVAFGPRCQGESPEQARLAASAWLERMDLAARAGALPRELSPGEARRVALARALAARPRILLLDEPLAALDPGELAPARTLLHRHLSGFTGACLLVTGDPLDAMVAADRLLVMDDGVVVQEGAPAEVARRPRTGHAARLAGLNLCRGHAAGRSVSVGGGTEGGGTGSGLDGGTVGGTGAVGGRAVTFTVREALRGPVFVAFPPSAVTLSRAMPGGTPHNLWRGGVEGIEGHGDRVRVRLGGPIAAAADLIPATLADLGLTPGDQVWACVPAAETHAYPAP
ncbi:ABC transporter ATP-binding protein [Sphaerisporangium album]|uniref:ABC transporter ATP-binding protein n=1 Tax=Sphaerisporangium album TaxID=509200 RepID=A0A367F9P9_9ACTN|nr:ABC transporter ATP-binding protein [Sphaerisporangium album]RCG26572.1 ABC transporter ATP-binding protein [Sphaerisporangium album]